MASMLQIACLIAISLISISLIVITFMKISPAYRNAVNKIFNMSAEKETEDE